MPTPEADKATITSFAGTPLVRVVDGGLSRNISPANLVAETGAQTALDARYGQIIDEDDMASDSATRTPSQQSVKAYVDANAGGSASSVSITDSGAYYTGTDVEAALQEIGAGTTLDARYLLETMWLSFGQFGTVGVGSPGTSNYASRPIWALDASTNEAVGATFTPPSTWSTFHIDAWMFNIGAGSGDYVLRCDVAESVDGGSISSNPSAGTPTTVTAAAQGTIKVSRMVTSQAISSGGMFTIRVLRIAADAADTLANDLGFLGLRLTRAS